MAILGAKMAWGVAIYVFGIDIRFMLHKCLNDCQIASEACDMQRRSKIIGPCIDLSPELDQNIDQRGMSFRCS